jgi:hypothetical protein
MDARRTARLTPSDQEVAMRRKQILSTDSEAGLKSSEMSAEFTGGYQQVQPFLKPRRL